MHELSATQIAAGCHDGTLDPGEVAAAFLRRIAELNPGLNAVVGTTPARLASDIEALRERLRRGERPPLAGVPVLVKDVIWVEGQNVTQGSMLFRDFVAPEDAPAVARLRRAGALIIGMANSSEFACKGLTTNKVYGLTRHPADPSLTPGGSSGGCASAVAARLAPLALGTDGGGSSRRPPAHVGAVGFKPSQGAIADPVGFPHAFNGIQVLAPIARNVADTELMFEQLAGPDVRDPQSIPLSADPPREAAGLHIAFSPRFGLDVPVDADVEACIARSIDVLRGAGLNIMDADPVWPEGANEDALMPLQHVGLANLFGQEWLRDPTQFDPDIEKQIARGMQWSGADVARAREAGYRIALTLGEFLSRHDLLICPTTPCVAWSADRLGPETIGGVTVQPRGHAVFTPFVNHAMAPAISIPCGTGRAGLPVGMQVIAARGRDRQLLAAAREIEAILAASAGRSVQPT
ncbi:MAG: amidase [Burkholderiaceae bacterium]|jgi:aspartyl-tRNA(Asn)/glutamyl-tRNA(Gln) amidotransferase subunit A|nr:amidase [Burkholderiaceae bacterium]